MIIMMIIIIVIIIIIITMIIMMFSFLFLLMRAHTQPITRKATIRYKPVGEKITNYEIDHEDKNLI